MSQQLRRPASGGEDMAGGGLAACPPRLHCIQLHTTVARLFLFLTCPAMRCRNTGPRYKWTPQLPPQTPILFVVRRWQPATGMHHSHPLLCVSPGRAQPGEFPLPPPRVAAGEGVSTHHRKPAHLTRAVWWSSILWS